MGWRLPSTPLFVIWGCGALRKLHLRFRDNGFDTVVALSLVIALSVAYALTLAPDITWANRGADGGDLITAAATGGVAHPPGYPTYLLLARLFQQIPIGTLAFRTNLLSTVCGLLSALIVADLTRRGCTGTEKMRTLAGFLAGLGFGLSPLLWSQAVITEVYTLHTLFVTLTLWLMPLSPEVQLFRKGAKKSDLFENPSPVSTRIRKTPTSSWLDRLGGLLFGLALGNHLTVAFLLPPWMLAGLLSTGVKGAGMQGSMGAGEHGMDRFSPLHPRALAPLLEWRSLTRRIAWLAIGLSIYLTLLIRARSGSPVNWGYPATLADLWWVVSGQYYRWRAFALPVYHLWPRLLEWGGLLVAQFGLLGFVLALYGFFFGKPSSRRYRWITGWVFVAFVFFAVGYNTHDAYVLLIPVFLVMSLWLGLGAAGLLAALARWRPKASLPVAVLGVLLVTAILLNAWQHLPTTDASRDDRAVNYGRQVMETAPRDAIVYTLDDEDSFTLWYYHFALKERTDLVVLHKRLLPEAWYRQTMRATYPGLTIPEQPDRIWYLAVMASNPYRPHCQTQLDGPEVLICSR